MSYKIGITDYVHPPYDVEQSAFPEAEFVFLDEEDEGKFKVDVLGELAGLIVWHGNISKLTAQHLKKGKIVVRYGVGYDQIEISSLTKANILFCNTPDYGTEEVADTACGMILNMQRKISSYDFACRNFQSGWQEHVQLPIKRTNKRTLGILGVGRIGTAVINRMKPFGCRIIGYDPYQPSGHEKAVGYHRVGTLDELLAESDILSIHCPLTDETRGMINRHSLSSLKKGAILINTSRGGVISDLACIEEVLRSGHLASAALDVLPDEPPSPTEPLIQAWKNHESWLQGRLLINPHTSYYSDDALYEMRYKAAETARMFLVSGIIRNRVTG